MLESCAFPFYYYYLFIISRLCPDQNYWCRSSLTTLLMSTGSVDFCGISDLYAVLHGNLPVTSQDHFGKHQYWVLVIANIGWHSDSHLNCVCMAARMVVDGSMASKPPWSRFRHAHGKWAWLQERKGTAHNLSWYCTYHVTSPVRIYVAQNACRMTQMQRKAPCSHQKGQDMFYNTQGVVDMMHKGPRRDNYVWRYPITMATRTEGGLASESQLWTLRWKN